MYNIIIASVLEFYAQPTLVSSLCIFQVTNPTGATNVESGLQTLETSPSIKRRSMGTLPRMSATPKRRTWPTCLMQAAIQTWQAPQTWPDCQTLATCLIWPKCQNMLEWTRANCPAWQKWPAPPRWQQRWTSWRRRGIRTTELTRQWLQHRTHSQPLPPPLHHRSRERLLPVTLLTSRVSCHRWGWSRSSVPSPTTSPLPCRWAPRRPSRFRTECQCRQRCPLQSPSHHRAPRGPADPVTVGSPPCPNLPTRFKITGSHSMMGWCSHPPTTTTTPITISSSEKHYYDNYPIAISSSEKHYYDNYPYCYQQQWETLLWQLPLLVSAAVRNTTMTTTPIAISSSEKHYYDNYPCNYQQQ